MPKIPNVQNSMFSPQKRQKAEDGGWWVEKMKNKPKLPACGCKLFEIKRLWQIPGNP